jgi:hypothetical protein
MWGLKGFIGIGGYEMGYLVKIEVSFIENMYWEGGSTKEFWEVFIISLKLYSNIP